MKPHDNERGPVCLFCGEVCKDNNNLKNHVLSHFYQYFYKFLPDKKPFECPKCNELKRDRITLIRHFAFKHKMFMKITGQDMKDIIFECSKEIYRNSADKYESDSDNDEFRDGGNSPEERRESFKLQDNLGAEKKEVHDDTEYFNMELRRQGLQMKIIPGDGNCQFRALADQMDGHEKNHERFRAEVVDFMRQNRQDFEPFIENNETFDDYTARILRGGHQGWGGEQELMAFARLYNVNIVLHQLNHPISSYGSQDARQLHISFHRDGLIIFFMILVFFCVKYLTQCQCSNN